MSNTFRYMGALIASALLFVSLSPNANAQTWASTATQAYPVQYLQKVQLIGSLAPSTPMHIAVGLHMQNASQVQPTLKAMLTPGNPLYGKSLTVPEFVAQFGPTAAQVSAVKNYLSSSGFKNLTVADNSLLIEADATAAEVQAAFNTSLAQYAVNGAIKYLNTMPAQVPGSLSGIVAAVLGLNDVATMHSDLKTMKISQTAAQNAALQTAPRPATDPCTPPASCPAPDTSNDTFTPEQYQIAYDAACPSDNTGCPAADFTSAKNTAVGIISEGDLTQVVASLRTAETIYSLPQVPVTVVQAGIPSADTSGAEEWQLDSQASTGIANQVSRLYFYVATSMTDSDLLGLAVNKAVSENKVKAFNMSFGECEYDAYIDGVMLMADEMFGEAALQGITPFASAGDQGSACPLEGTNGVPLSGPPDTAYPASSPYVISVGGTNLLTNSDYTYDYEIAWEASGGGISYFETAPFWQSFTGSGSEPIVLSTEDGDRGVPDVSMCAGGSEEAICAAIVWSAPSPGSASGTNPVDVLPPGPQPTNTTGCSVAKNCIVSDWVTNSNATTMADITSPITAPFYVMPNSGQTPLTPGSATGDICLVDTTNYTGVYAAIASNCVAGGGVALIMYPVSSISAPSTIPVFTIASEANGTFLANGVTGASSYNIRIDVATPGPTSALVAGTSLSSPLAMGSWARIETSHKNKLGFAGPLIYQLANGAPTLTSPYFNDVILGSNGLFAALPGYDYVTGLGSWDIFVVNQNIPSTYPQ